MNPGPFTLRELLAMAEANGRERWEHTSHILATLININRKKGRPPVQPNKLNPYTVHKRAKFDPVVAKRVLKQTFNPQTTQRIAAADVKLDPTHNPTWGVDVGPIDEDDDDFDDDE